ncbi:CHASE domain-containing protein [Litorilituus sediminis]|uniref:histidine kinase n=1 Tax=Litorilituus sediminis TaxID=718192 RepID=A0A4V0ZFW8_9GAMM|nr:CHASE domain-containing protein [Litorilituus sediminis]QBG35250.1 histidine kinase [Litorilituus sediminis]
MPLGLQRFFFASSLYFTVCVSALMVMSPFSLINYVGPAAAVASGLIIIWGAPALFAVIVTTPIFVAFLNKYLLIDVHIAATLIATLAIILQSFWAKQLVHKYVFYRKWLRSRRWLLQFFLRVGPLASLVSAVSALVISVIDNQVMLGSFFYTFMSAWSSSMLVSVFFIPLVLLAQEQELSQLSVSKRFFIVSASVLAGLAVLLLLKTSQDEQQYQRLNRFLQEKQDIERVIKQEVHDVIRQLNSLSALFNASEKVTRAEFEVFSEDILGENTSIRALEWAPIITDEQRTAFELNATKELAFNYVIRERAKGNKLYFAQKREVYAPLYYIYPKENNLEVLGLDVYSNPKQALSMSQVALSEHIVASAPIALAQENFNAPGVLFTKAVYKKNNGEEKNNQFKEAQQLVGFVVAVVQFDKFLNRLVAGSDISVNFQIEDITDPSPHIIYGKSVSRLNRHVDTLTLPIYSRLWQITLAEQQPWFVQDKSWQVWVMLIGGTLGALTLQLLLLMMAAYSIELTQQVNNKTRAVILAKEKSERESLAKTHFLRTLNDEFRVPLQAIRVFIEQFKQKGINNKQVVGINHASNNISQLLDTMMDISEIESGKTIVKEEAFDFYGFLNRVELMLKANNIAQGKSIFLLIDKEVPHFIDSDELRIQKLLIAFTEGAQALFNTDSLRLSVKVHTHLHNRATLFFIYSHQDESTSHESDDAVKALVDEDLASFSTAMTMVKEMSNLMQGSVRLGTLTSGGGMLSTSIKVTVTSQEKQDQHQAQYFDEFTHLD